MKSEDIVITGLKENNLKNVNVRIPKQKLVVFTGVSGSGKSSIVFDTVAAESQRQMNESYSAFIRGRLPKYPKPHVDKIENLTSSVIVDQTPLGGNARSTVGTITDLYTSLRLIFSRIGTPYVGTASYFSFNNPNGMCRACSGLGRVTRIDLERYLDRSKSLNEGGITFSLYKPDAYYWSQLQRSKFFDMDKKLCDYSEEEMNLLLYGNRAGLTAEKIAARDGVANVNGTTPKPGSELRESKFVEGLYVHLARLVLNRDTSVMSKASQQHQASLVTEEECPDCHGLRLNESSRNCKVAGYTINEMCAMEFAELRDVLSTINDTRVQTVVDSLIVSLDRMINIGLPYLSLDRESSTLSGGEGQRVKLVRYMGSSLTDLTYIFDEPSTGLHPRDVWRMNNLLADLRDKGNTVLVVEHDRDVISQADHIIDVGPRAGKDGGEIVFTGTYDELLHADTLSGKAMNMKFPFKNKVRTPKSFLTVEHAMIHNLKDVTVNIPEGVITVVTGVAGSGKSSLISHAFASQFEDRIVKVDQGPITATNRSTPASFLGFFDEIRKLFASVSGEDAGLFSFNSIGACPVCQGKGVVVTELVFMDPIITPCEACGQTRYNDKALGVKFRGKSIVEVLEMTADEALEFFSLTDSSAGNAGGAGDAGNEGGADVYTTGVTAQTKKCLDKICKCIKPIIEVGLSYMTLGQPLSTLSGGERQRVKLAKYLNQKGNIYILDEPTTGLHVSDTGKLLELFDKLVEKGNTVIIIEHDLDVVKYADYVIDIGPDGGKNGGQVVFAGTPREMFDTGKTITADWLRKTE